MGGGLASSVSATELIVLISETVVLVGNSLRGAIENGALRCLDCGCLRNCSVHGNLVSVGNCLPMVFGWRLRSDHVR